MTPVIAKLGSFEFLYQCFSCSVVCKLLTFNIRLSSHRFHEGVNAVDPIRRRLNHTWNFGRSIIATCYGPLLFIFSGLCHRKVFRSLTGHLGPLVTNAFGWTPLLFLRSPSLRFFVGFSSYVTYSTPLSSLLNEKSSTNMLWCSWQPRNPKCYTHTQKKKNKNKTKPILWLLGTLVTGCQGEAVWTTTISSLSSLVSACLWRMGTFAVDLFTEEASFPLEYFAAVNKLCCSLPLSDGLGTLTLPANCLARSPNRPVLLSRLGEKLL